MQINSTCVVWPPLPLKFRCQPCHSHCQKTLLYNKKRSSNIVGGGNNGISEISLFERCFSYIWSSWWRSSNKLIVCKWITFQALLLKMYCSFNNNHTSLFIDLCDLATTKFSPKFLKWYIKNVKSDQWSLKNGTTFKSFFYCVSSKFK